MKRLVRINAATTPTISAEDMDWLREHVVGMIEAVLHEVDEDDPDLFDIIKEHVSEVTLSLEYADDHDCSNDLLTMLASDFKSVEAIAHSMVDAVSEWVSTSGDSLMSSSIDSLLELLRKR